MEEKKVLLSVQDLVVKFKVRGRSLTAIRGISLDIYDGESIAIVGESGSGKSVFTKTFANMLDSNGYVDSGKIIFNDPDLAEVTLDVGHKEDVRMTSIRLKLDAYSKLEHGADTYKAMKAFGGREEGQVLHFRRRGRDLPGKARRPGALSGPRPSITSRPLDSHEKDKMKEASAKISALDKQIEAVEEERKKAQQEKAKAAAADTAYNEAYAKKMADLKEQYRKEISEAITLEQHTRNVNLAKEIYLSVGRYDMVSRNKMIRKLLKCCREAMRQGLDMDSRRGAQRCVQRRDLPGQAGGRGGEPPVRPLCAGPGQYQVQQGPDPDPRQEDRHGFPGPHDLAEPHYHHRPADHLHHPQAPALL